jgi:hypothetical protein
MWVDDDHVLINTEGAPGEVQGRPARPACHGHDLEDDPYTYAEVRGRVVETVRGPEARAHIDRLSQKYRGKDYDESTITSERVILRIAPETMRIH